MTAARGTVSEPPAPEFKPVRMDEVELAAPLPDLPTSGPEGGTVFGGSMCLVRLHEMPLGILDLELPEGGLPAAELAARIEAELGEAIAAHLRDDGLPPQPLTATGLEGVEEPPCLRSREEFLARAPMLSVVICTRDRPDSVRITLESILSCQYPSDRYEVIVVDNAAEGDSVVDVVESEFQGQVAVRVVREPVAGLSHARNRGLADANGEIVVFADDDVLVDRNWLYRLAAAFASGEKVGASSGLTLPDVLETPTQRWIEGFGGRMRGFERVLYDVDDPPADRPLFPFTVGDFGAGRNMAFDRQLLLDLGGFDVALGPGALAHDGDDVEALLRVLLSGRQLAHDPKAIVWHAHPRDYQELEDRVWGYGVGYTACLTRAVLDHPGLLLEMARKLPRGLKFALSPSSEKNSGRQGDFPKHLVRSEILGMAYGPIAYFRSRRDQRRRRRTGNGRGPATAAEADGDGPGARLKILFVCDEYPPVVGGAAKNLQLLAEYLSPRHDVVVATSWQPNTAASEEMNGVPVHRVRDSTTRAGWLSSDPYRHHAPPFPDPEAVARLRRLVEAERPDLVYTYGWIAAAAASALRGQPTPLILAAHDYGNFCAQFTLVRKGETCSGPQLAKCLDCAAHTYGAAKGAVAVGSVFGSKPLLRRRVAALHGVSSFVAERNAEEIGIPPERTFAIPNFHEVEQVEVDPGDLPAELPDEPFIMFVGHLRPYKGLEVLLDAYRQLQRRPPLVLVGTKAEDTPERFPDGVRVFTYMPHPTVMALWQRSLFAVSPSIAPEAFPTVVHEAMSCGKPVIGTNLGGYLDMIDPGENGLLVPPGDAAALAAAMHTLIVDEDLRTRLGENARERAREYTPQAVLPRIERLFRETAAQASRR